MIKDSVNILLEGTEDGGYLYGSIEVPEGGDQSANLVVSGTTSGVVLKDLSIKSGAGDLSRLEGTATFEIDAKKLWTASFSRGTAINFLRSFGPRIQCLCALGPPFVRGLASTVFQVQSGWQ